jgi:predicted polyphosphate/ATP-dependent NAD kinase
MAETVFRIGFVMNPLAGLGGTVALKGSDGADTVALAQALGAVSRVADRCRQCLAAIGSVSAEFRLLTVDGEMGSGLCDESGLACQVIYSPAPGHTAAEDTRRAVQRFMDAGVDLVLFAGGDGTARDVCDVVHTDQLVLGIPCGVKMHSGVFAVNPTAAGKVLLALVKGELVSAMQGEVRDIDESSFREGRVKTKWYGEMWVPAELHYVQHVKSGGREIAALAVQEIAAGVIEQMDPAATYFIGGGSTTMAIMEALGLPGTLLGIDVIRDGQLLLADARESDLMDFATNGDCHIVVTFIAGQGHVFGRGNQQLSARIIRQVGLRQITIIGTKTKLEGLDGQPLRVDTGDPELDSLLAGTVRVVTGYEDRVLYPLVG